MAQGEISGAVAPEDHSGKRRRKGKFVVIIFILLFFSLGGYIFFNRSLGESEVSPLAEVTPKPRGNAPLKTEDQAALAPTPLFGEANYQSENFRVGEVAIGGEAEFLLTEDTPTPLEIRSVRGEAFTEKNGQEVKLVLTWQTNKLSVAEIEYSKGVGQPKKSLREEDYSLNHSMIIPGLDQASTYVYTITASDRFGNQVASDSYALYTGSRSVSLFDLIAGAIGDVFGWAVDKK